MSAPTALAARPASTPPDACLVELPRLALSQLLRSLDAPSLAALAVAAPRHFREAVEAEAEARLRPRWPDAPAAALWCCSLCILTRVAPSVADVAAPPFRVVCSPPWSREVETFAAELHREARASRRPALPRATLAALQRAARRGDVTAAELLSFFQRGWRSLAARLGSPSAWARQPPAHPLDFRPQREAARQGHLPSLLAHGVAWLTGFPAAVPHTLLAGDAAAALGAAGAASYAVLFPAQPVPDVALVLFALAIGLSLLHDGAACEDAVLSMGSAAKLQLEAAVLRNDGTEAMRLLVSAVAAYDLLASPHAALRLASLLAPPMPAALLAAGVVRSLEEVPVGEAACASARARGVLLARLMGVRGHAPVSDADLARCRADVRRSIVADATRFAAPGALAGIIPDFMSAVADSPPLLRVLHQLDADPTLRRRARAAAAAACTPAGIAPLSARREPRRA